MNTELNLSLTPSQLPDVLSDMARIGKTINISGSPGIGKSQCIEQFVADRNLHLTDIRLSQYESVDLNGFPTPNQKTGKMQFLPVEQFILEGDQIPDNKSGVCIFLDEINAAPRSTIAAAYKLTLERRIGSYNIHPKTVIIAAGNLKSDKAIVNDTGTAMQSKMINVKLSVSNADWLKWAVRNGVDSRVISFIKFKADLLHKFNPNHTEENFPCPRTWSFLSNYISTKKKLSHVDLVVMAGCVGEGAATEFKAFSNIYHKLPTLNDIVSDPSGFTIKDEPSIQYALTTLMSSNLEHHPAELIEAIGRLGIEFQVVCIREAVTRDRTIKLIPEVDAWCIENSEVLF